MAQKARDIQWTDDGDLLVDDTGDLQLADEERTVVQDIEFRTRTQHWDYGPEPLIGANLQRYRGWKQARHTGDNMKEDVYYALVKDGRFRKADLFVQAVPVGPNSIGVYVFVQDVIEGHTGDIQERATPLVVGFSVSLSGEDTDISRITGGKE
jgi:hypothetical protein